MIKISNAHKTFVKPATRKTPERKVEVLNGIDLDIQENEFITIVGPSGCGKTTLLRAIAGLVKLDSGSIVAAGETVAGPSPDRAMVFQSFALMPWANVIRNVAFGLEVRGVDKDEREQIARDLIKTVGLAGFENSLPSELSGGMKQRVGLARALYGKPVFVVLDEPNSSLDEAGDAALAKAIATMKQLGTTFVIMTHRTSVLGVADKMLIMRDGTQQAFGPRDEVLAAMQQAKEKISK